MGVSVKVRDLSIIFGTKQQIEKALNLIDEDLSAIEIKEITGATVANKNINFDIKENELFVIVGLSGSGKSTFIRSLNRLNKVTKGNVIVDGMDVTKMNEDELREYRRTKVSMIFQNFGLLTHKTVLENVYFPLEIKNVSLNERINKAKEAIEMVGLKGWEDYMIHQLSGGMQQRVGLARALVNDPELLLMDEPYSALDPLIRKEMQNELLELEDQTQRTIIFITHDMNEAFRLGDRIALMKDGEVVQVGKPLDFFENPANSYVRAFVDDVDKTRVLKVRNVMRRIKHSAKLNDSVEKTIKFMDDKNIEACFVTDENNKLIGAVERKVITDTKETTIKNIVDRNVYKTINRNDYLKDIYKNLQTSDYDVPVLDSKGRLRGILGYDDVFKALS